MRYPRDGNNRRTESGGSLRGFTMRLAAKWQGTWPFSSTTPEGVMRTRIRVGGELVDLVRMGTGDPLIVVPGLAGSWGLLLPLARRLAHRFEVITYGLRGDGFPAP